MLGVRRGRGRRQYRGKGILVSWEYTLNDTTGCLVVSPIPDSHQNCGIASSRFWCTMRGIEERKKIHRLRPHQSQSAQQ